MDKEYFLTDSTGDQFYTKDTLNLDRYPEHVSDPYDKYARDTYNKIIYAKDATGSEVYATDKSIPILPRGYEGHIQYAKSELGDEFYPIHPDISELMIRNWFPYAKTKQGKEIYPFKNGKPILLMDRYALNEENIPYYPQDASGNEIMLEDRVIMVKYRRIHPMNKEGRPIYRCDSEGNEIYDHKGSIILNNSNGVGVYARRNNLDEYYPEDDLFATESDGITPIYARSSTSSIIFPRDPYGIEYYLPDPNTESDFIGNGLKTYAKYPSGFEIYPKTFVNQFTLQETVLNDTYAEDGRDLYYYPMDACGNEYTIPRKFDGNPLLFVPPGYPITNDRFAIIPHGFNGPQLLTQADLTMENIVGMLYQPALYDYVDYITDFKSPRISRSPPLMYKFKDKLNRIQTRNSPMKQPSHHPIPVWIIPSIIIAILALILIVWKVFL